MCSRVWSAVLLWVLGSCAHWNSVQEYPVVVDISPNREIAVDRRHAFCFVAGAAAYPNEPAKNQRHDQLARICSQHARTKGVSIAVAPGPQAACIPCRLEWSVAGPDDANARPAPREGSRKWRARREQFSKRLRLTAVHPDGPVLVEASATTWSDNAAFTDDTAEILCRALFANFPFETTGKHYDVALDRY